MLGLLLYAAAAAATRVRTQNRFAVFRQTPIFFLNGIWVGGIGDGNNQLKTKEKLKGKYLVRGGNTLI